MTRFDINAYNKLNGVFNYAQDIKTSPEASGGDTVVRLRDGDALSCSYSRDDAPRGLFNRAARSQDQKNLNDATRAIFKQSVIEIFGTSINDVPKNVRSAMKLADYDCGKPLTARRIVAVNKAIGAALKAYAKTLGITGGGASEIASAIAKQGDVLKATDPAATYKSRVNRNATDSIKVHIASQASKEANGQLGNDAFDVDFVRGMGLTVGGKRIKSRDPAEARDRLVQFLTGDKHATFAGAADDVKRQVKVLLSMMHQGTFACILPSVYYSFDQNAQNAPFSLMEGGGDQSNSFSISKDGDGNITIKAVVKYTQGFNVNVGQIGMAPKVAGNGSYAKFEAEIKMTSNNLKWLADRDWTQVDTQEADNTMYDIGKENRFNSAAEMIPVDYQFTGSVNVDMKVHLDTLGNP